ncbi:MAG TPA: hypothetical protein VLE89_04475 [Chlamydiales bacterium]|nr:hypothetical protein [Chlamydiales bacterium]
MYSIPVLSRDVGYIASVPLAKNSSASYFETEDLFPSKKEDLDLDTKEFVTRLINEIGFANPPEPIELEKVQKFARNRYNELSKQMEPYQLNAALVRLLEKNVSKKTLNQFAQYSGFTAKVVYIRRNPHFLLKRIELN